MPAFLTSPAFPCTGVLAPPAVRQTALYLPGDGRPYFAWLHRPEGTPPSDHAVVICPPVGHEQVHSHRALRHLADASARCGLPTLRLDYDGTGDSPGSDEDPGRLG